MRALHCGRLGSIYSSLPSLLAATVAFAIGTSVVLRDRSRDEYVLFAVFCFNLGLFHLATFFHGILENAAFLWGAQTISLVLPWSADRCFRSLVPGESTPRKRSRIRTIALVVLILAQAAAFFTLLGISPLRIEELQQGPWRLISMGLNAYVVFGLLLVAMRMWRAARASEGTATAPRLRYLFYASLVALAFGSPLVPAMGPIVTAVYLYFVAQTLQRERLLELPEVLARIATLTLLVVGITGLFSLLLLWIPTQARGRSSLFVFNIAVASYAVIVLIEPLRTELESRIEQWLFKDRSVLRAILAQLRFKLLNVIDPDEMVQVIVDALRDSNRVTRASFYLLDARGMSLVLHGEIDGATYPRLDLATRRPLIERMRSEGAQLRDVLARQAKRTRQGREVRTELEEIVDTMAELNASLAIPILLKHDQEDRKKSASDRLPELMGALFVDDERLLEPFSREEVELFEGVAAQAAITLKNSAVFQRRKERDRLAALGEMAAGLAHEIRNPLGAIKGAAQLVQPTIDKADPNTAEFLGVIVEEVDRLNRVVTQFLSYSRPFKGEKTSVDIHAVVRATLRVLDPDDAARFTLELDDALPQVRGDGEALRQVFLNLARNAADAVRPLGAEGNVTVSTKVRSRGLVEGDAIAIAFRDNGPGLSPETMTNLFVPFHTTKDGGTGLGLPISQRIVENHRGVIEVVNAVNAGAQFTVLLPVDHGDLSTTASMARPKLTG